MCFPNTYQSAGYVAASIFLYRGIMVLVQMICNLATGTKMSYIPFEVSEEVMIQLLYFVAIFSLACLTFIGVEGESKNMILFPALGLLVPLFCRYGGEIGYIYLLGWNSYKSKIAWLATCAVIDLILITILLAYARNLYKNRQMMQRKKSFACSCNDKFIYKYQMKNEDDDDNHTQLPYNSLQNPKVKYSEHVDNIMVERKVPLKGSPPIQSILVDRNRREKSEFEDYDELNCLEADLPPSPPAPIAKLEYDDSRSKSLSHHFRY